VSRAFVDEDAAHGRDEDVAPLKPPLPPGGERTLRIVGVDEADPGSGDVSWISPIARALMGARVGDTVRCDLPAGPTRLRVLSIDYL
jgi:transcription elongation GreA/GreB family factor